MEPLTVAAIVLGVTAFVAAMRARGSKRFLSEDEAINRFRGIPGGDRRDPTDPRVSDDTGQTTDTPQGESQQETNVGTTLVGSGEDIIGTAVPSGLTAEELFDIPGTQELFGDASGSGTIQPPPLQTTDPLLAEGPATTQVDGGGWVRHSDVFQIGGGASDGKCGVEGLRTWLKKYAVQKGWEIVVISASEIRPCIKFSTDPFLSAGESIGAYLTVYDARPGTPSLRGI